MDTHLERYAERCHRKRARRKVKVYDTVQTNHKCHQAGEEATSTPTEATRRHANVAREGRRAERMREDGESLENLKIEDTGQEEGGNEHIPPRQQRRHVKVAREGGGREESVTKIRTVRREAQKSGRERGRLAECVRTVSGAAVVVVREPTNLTNLIDGTGHYRPPTHRAVSNSATRQY